MKAPFQELLDTTSLWLPALGWVMARLHVTSAGEAISEKLRERFRWLRDPKAESAFQKAFRTGIKNYQDAHGRTKQARAVGQVLLHLAYNDLNQLDRAMVLEQILSDSPNPQSLTQIVRRYVHAFEGIRINNEQVEIALNELIVDFLRPAFRNEPYFTNAVASAQIIELLTDIRRAVASPEPNLDNLERDYRNKHVEKHHMITMQGISPKVQNRTVGIRMASISRFGQKGITGSQVEH